MTIYGLLTARKPAAGRGVATAAQRQRPGKRPAQTKAELRAHGRHREGAARRRWAVTASRKGRSRAALSAAQHRRAGPHRLPRRRTGRRAAPATPGRRAAAPEGGGTKPSGAQAGTAQRTGSGQPPPPGGAASEEAKPPAGLPGTEQQRGGGRPHPGNSGERGGSADERQPGERSRPGASCRKALGGGAAQPTTPRRGGRAGPQPRASGAEWPNKRGNHEADRRARATTGRPGERGHTGRGAPPGPPRKKARTQCRRHPANFGRLPGGAPYLIIGHYSVRTRDMT